jgi:hypothetical protein
MFHVFVSLTCSLDKHRTVYKTEYAVLSGVHVYVVHSTLALKLEGCSSRWNYNQQSRYRWCYWKVGFADVSVTWQLAPRVRRKVFSVYIQPSGWWHSIVEFSNICIHKSNRQISQNTTNFSITYVRTFVFIIHNGDVSPQKLLYLFLRQLVHLFCKASMSYFCSHLWNTSFIGDCHSTDNKARRVFSIVVGVLIFIVHINAFHIGLIA